jgi:hypothetical protein
MCGHLCGAQAITYPLRFALWKASQNCVYARNAEAAKSRFFMRVNAMHDMTEDEFKKTLGLREMTGANARFRAKNVLSAEDSLERSVVESLRAGSGSAVADPYSGKSLDWRSKGVFAPIAFQGQCGNCWAWTSATLVEAAWKIAGYSTTGLGAGVWLGCVLGLTTCALRVCVADHRS